MTFDSLGLSEPLLRAVRATGYATPTPIQHLAVPPLLAGSDVMAAAQTGTGKTAGFTLPLLQRLSEGPAASSRRPRALVLTPTRELAAQVHESIVTYGRYLALRSAVVFGGVGIGPQKQKLQRGVEILVATPGRLLDLCQQQAVQLDHIEVLVLDEADRMLDMGFIHDIRKILAQLPRRRQTAMFSATFSGEIRALAKTVTRAPVELDASPRNSAVETVSHKIHPVDKARKAELLSHLIRDGGWHQVLVFSRTKHGADKLVRRLGRDDIQAAAIHGNKSQGQRTRALDGFKRNKLQVLVATDIAARGIDIEHLQYVVNMELPNVPEDYVHRIGRTGRAGASGRAISLVSADEADQLAGIERLTRLQIDREEVAGFAPQLAVPRAARGEARRGKRPGGGRPHAPGGGRQRPRRSA